jgi:hypothetical protein
MKRIKLNTAITQGNENVKTRSVERQWFYMSKNRVRLLVMQKLNSLQLALFILAMTISFNGHAVNCEKSEKDSLEVAWCNASNKVNSIALLDKIIDNNLSTSVRPIEFSALEACNNALDISKCMNQKLDEQFSEKIKFLSRVNTSDLNKYTIYANACNHFRKKPISLSSER